MAPPTSSSFVTLVPRRHHRFSPAIFSRPARALHRNGVFDAVPRRTPIALSRPGRVGRSSPDSCRPGRMPMTAVLGHEETLAHMSSPYVHTLQALLPFREERLVSAIFKVG